MNAHSKRLLRIANRCVLRSRGLSSGIDWSNLQVIPAPPVALKSKPQLQDLNFGQIFTDHMLTTSWSASSGWSTPLIKPLEPIPLHPAAKVLHYAQELFEGLKAFRGVDDKIRLFRPQINMARLNMSARRSKLPTIEGKAFLNCVRKLIQIEQEWVPHAPGSSLYIRPTLIGTEAALGVNPSKEAMLFVILSPVGSYFAQKNKSDSKNVVPEGINLLADPRFTRAFPGGTGFAKMGCNYAPTLWTQEIASKHDCAQNLWLFGPNDQITEVGAMNIFIYMIDKHSGKKALFTPSLEGGLILPGVVRRSIIELVQKDSGLEVVEREIYMKELIEGLNEGRVIEVFGAGTAATICPVKGIYYKGEMLSIPMEKEERISQEIRSKLYDIFYGRIEHPWAVDIETWNLEQEDQNSFSDFEHDLMSV